MSRKSPQVARQELVAAVKTPAQIAALPLHDLDDLLRLARRANLLGRLAEGAHACGVLDRLPDPVRIHLQSARVMSAHQRQAIGWELGHLGKALADLGVPVVLLKGAAYVAAGLPAARGRMFGDIDVLVPRAALNRAEAALMLHGWSSGAVDPYDDRYYRRWMHELPPMVNQRRGTVIDLHHGILPDTARNRPPAAALLEASLPVPESCFRVFAPCDMVIHSAVHLFHEGELQNGLRDMFDLDGLIDNFARARPEFWDELAERARVLDSVWPLQFALHFLDRVLGSTAPASAMAARLPAGSEGRLRRTVRDAMYLRAFAPDHPMCTDVASSLSRLGLFVRGHYLRMPPGLLALHLGRKGVMHLFKSSSRSV